MTPFSKVSRCHELKKIIATLNLFLFAACLLFPGTSLGRENWFDLGIFELKSRRYQAAIEAFSKAIEINPHDDMAYNHRGIAWSQKGDYDRAVADYTKAIDINPRYTNAYNHRGIAWTQKGDYDQAIADYTKAIDITPRYANAYNNRGGAWSQKGDYDQAIADYTKAIDINPRYTNAYRNRGSTWYQKGDYFRAIEDYGKVLELKPSYWIYNHLAWILATCPDDKYRNGEKALQYAKKAVAIKREVISLGTLAAAYAEAGKFGEAVTTQGEVIELLRNDNKPEMLTEYLKRLKVYKSKVTLQKKMIALQQEKPLDANRKPGEKIRQNTLQQPTSEAAKGTNRKVYPYIIQISAYREKETSAREALKYKNKGDPVFNSYAYIQRKKGEEWYRIFFGYYASLEKAREAVLELKRRKFRQTNVLKKPYAVEVGSFTSEQELKKVEADLQQNNYIAYRLPAWKEEGKIILLVGAFKTEKAAERQAVKLQEIGLKTRVVQR